MKAFLATVLSVIAAGVLLIAYGVLAPRAPMYPDSRAMVASQRVGLVDDGYAVPQAAAYGYGVRPAVAYPVSDVRAYPDANVYARPRPAASSEVVTRAPRPRAAVVERTSGRSWQKTAMVIGGSSAAGAGLGAIFGGKKGALIGAAIGGGAGTLFEVNKRQ